MPIYIFPNGTVERNYTIKEQIEKYYPTYKFYLSLYDVTNITVRNVTIDFNKMFVNLTQDSVKQIKDSQFIAASRKLGNMAVMSYYSLPKETADKYYWLKNDHMLKRASNWAGNWCFITLTIIFAINFIFIILMMVLGFLTPKFVNKNNQVFKTDLLKYEEEYMRAKTDDLIFDPSLNILRNNIYGYLYLAEPVEKAKEPIGAGSAYENKNPEQGIELQNVNVEMKDNQNVNSEAAMASNRSKKVIEAPHTNSLIHFIFKRNIYANMFTFTSPFNPLWKNMTKYFTLLNLLCFFATCMFIYSGITFNLEDPIQYESIVQSVFLSILMSNVAFTIINLLYSSKINSNSISDVIKTGFNEDSMSSIRTINLIKTIFLTLLSFLIFGGTFYMSFCLYSVYSFYGNQLIVTWLLTLVFDFIVMEILMEVFISMLMCCKGNCLIDSLLGMMIGIKNLRNSN